MLYPSACSEALPTAVAADAANGDGLSVLQTPSSFLPSDGRERGKGGGKRPFATEEAETIGFQGMVAIDIETAPAADVKETNGSHLCSNNTYLQVAQGKTLTVPFSSEGKRLKQQAEGKGENFRFGAFNASWVLEDILSLCQLSSGVGEGKLPLQVSLSQHQVLETASEYERHGVILYFMGKLPKGLHLRWWVRSVLGEDAVSKFIFLGKGFFLALCKESKFKFKLLEKGGAWGHGIFGMAMPWHLTFDPMAAFLHFCPVWITLKEVPVLLLPHLDQIVSAMGKVLYMPTLDQFVYSRNVRVCVLWNMSMLVPGLIQVDLGMDKLLHVEVAFQSFPTACYKCKTIGHYAKDYIGSSRMEEQHCTEATPAQILELKIDRKDAIITNCQNSSSEDKELLVDTEVDHEHSKDETDLERRLPLSELNNSQQINSTKKRHKKKKKKKLLKDLKENLCGTNEESMPLHNQGLSTEIEKENTEEDMETKSDEEKDTLKDESAVKDAKMMNEELKVDSFKEEAHESAVSIEDAADLDEIDKEILASVREHLHEFYMKGEHFFLIPGHIQKINKEWKIYALNDWWDPSSFFRVNNLNPNAVVFDSPDGEIEWKGKV